MININKASEHLEMAMQNNNSPDTTLISLRGNFFQKLINNLVKNIQYESDTILMQKVFKELDIPITKDNTVQVEDGEYRSITSLCAKCYAKKMIENI
jgi:hypothetical protein